KNCTASLPSTIRWSYDNAKYIIGRTSIESSGITTARFTILCIPRIPTCGAFKIGVVNIEPKIPPFVIENEPPCNSSIPMCYLVLLLQVQQSHAQLQQSLVYLHRELLEQLVHLVLIQQYRYHSIL